MHHTVTFPKHSVFAVKAHIKKTCFADLHVPCMLDFCIQEENVSVYCMYVKDRFKAVQIILKP